jgi:hypothetical protein
MDKTLEVAIDNLEELVDKTLLEYMPKKKGRPFSKRNLDIKAYERISISMTKEEKNKVKLYADEYYFGNISELVKSLLKKKKII